MSEFVLRGLLAAPLAAVIALGALWLRALAPSGAAAAIVVGTAVTTGGGWWAGLMLVAFFSTSSALSRLARKPGGAEQARGSRRDAVQVLANGSVAALAALAIPLAPAERAAVALAAVAGALAAATADTWATEIGRGSARAPLLITSGKPVARGVSGGVTPRGTLGSLAGAALIGLLAGVGAGLGVVPGDAALRPAALVALVVAAGFLGSVADSLLGATLQLAYRCPVCGALTERTRHCGVAAVRVKGAPGIDNDVVNWLATATGASIAATLAALLA